MTIDGRRILFAQALRAFVYGFGAVLLGVGLDHRHWSTTRRGLLPPAILAGTAVGGDHRFFLLFVPVGVLGAVVALSLSPRVEARSTVARSQPLTRSRVTVHRLAGLFALDSFGGGFAVQSFLVFFLSKKFGLSVEQLGLVFFAVGFLQTASFLAAGRLAERFG